MVRPRIGEQLLPDRRVHDGAAEGGGGTHRDDVEGKAARHHCGGEGGGGVPAQVAGLEPHHRREALQRLRRLAPLGENRRGELREHGNAAVVAHDRGDRPHVLLQEQPGLPVPISVESGPRPNRFRRGQVDRGPHRGMPRERHLHLGREDAHPCRPLGGLRRPQEHRLGKIHLQRNPLHQLRRQMRRVRKDPQRVAAEGRISEDIEGSEVEFHVRTPIRQRFEATPTRRPKTTLSYTPCGSPSRFDGDVSWACSSVG